MKADISEKEAVLKKFYGGERKSYMHDFRLSDGKYLHCGIFIGDALQENWPRVCNVITPDEMKNVKMDSD